MKLAESVALVTGGGRGIGRAIALALAAEGAKVAVTARSQTQIEAVAAEIRVSGGEALAVACDVADPDQVHRAVERVAVEWGGLDILINNAGGGTHRVPVIDSEPAAWTEVVQVNLLGTYYAVQAALPHLITRGGGKIINIGSGMGHSPRAGNSSYNVAKAGVWMLTRCLALEVWQHGIDVNEIVPGPVLTELTSEVFGQVSGGPPPFAASERVKQPSECVPLVLFLASHPPGGPTGQTFSLARRPID